MARTYARRRMLRLQESQSEEGHEPTHRPWEGTHWEVERRVVGWAAGVRGAVLLLGCLTALLVPSYDLSPQALALAAPHRPPALLPRLLGGFANWDGVYFTHLASAHGATYGEYTYEHFYAFFPGLPLAIRGAASLLSPLARLPLVGGEGGVQLLAGLLVANGCSVLAAVVLYRLTLIVLRDSRTAFTSALLFALTPAGIFYSAVYTESLYALLSLLGLLLLYRRRPWAASLLFALATLVRSNGVTMAGFLWWEAVWGLSYPLERKGPLPNVRGVGVTLLSCVGQSMVVGLPLVAHLHSAYALHCTAENPAMHLSPWCQASPPNVYSYIQVKYWDNGLFRYWQWRQIPNFLLAAPMVGLCSLGVMWYLWRGHYSLSHVWAHRKGANSPPQPAPLCYLRGEVLVFVGHWAALTVIAVLTMNVQVVTRFVSACPALYWCAAAILQVSHGPRAGWMRWSIPALLGYFLAYTVVGTVLFVSFYPWT